ncbi:hypothetical protein, partial [Vibrio vulnificus]|uniref:hypothetical protein n=1 Tax=Vibrio vulnificus TaxID=672 RepID=UPI003EDA6840
LVAPRLAGMTGGGLSVFIALFTDNCRLKRPPRHRSLRSSFWMARHERDSESIAPSALEVR